MSVISDPRFYDGEGLKHMPESPGKADVSATGGAESGALGAQSGDIPPDLRLVVEVWGTLPEATKVGILAMVRAAGETAE